MKVNPSKTTINFDKIPNGGVFKYTDRFFLKMEPLEPKGEDFIVNAVSLDGDCTVEFQPDDFVAYYPNANLNLV